ncbi:MAG: MAPEG family protein [Rhodospirillaceae bacterium]|jgi:glutathione S-transferase|nr:MAPEG family protein [Rhodospirillaceae bacterium]
MNPLYPAAVTLLALLFYMVVTMNSGRNRTKHNIAPPSVTGHEDYERAYRVQMNTLEHMVFFLPSMWLFAWSVSANWAAGIGLLWIAGRIIYASAYYRDPAKRPPGMLITFAAQVILFIGALIGVGGMFI